MRETAASFVLQHLRRRHHTQWLSGPRRPRRRREGGELAAKLEALGFTLPDRQRHKLAGLDSLQELWQHYFFRGVVLDSHEGFVGWLEHRYPLEARLDVPTPLEMLEAQCDGRRFVTLLLHPEEQLKPRGRFKDACDFALHDFEHAHKFYGESHAGQVKFFRALRDTLSCFDIWSGDAQFTRDLHYLMSDMNSHPVHLMKYLKAVVLAAEIRRRGLNDPPLDGFWRELFQLWSLGGESLASALHLNQPAVETAEDARRVAEFFMLPDSSCARDSAVST